ncbi:Serine/threonine-protein phosphatase 4 regulatory subunit 3B [Myotis davidii]|uniref:Serine/threonine-protein phosphatase 4 regulatory subunit 3B n=1 Tax=Myotis davidii TaxID=225400 RepID=L5ME33_MYODS|nr:Serine/threonine-protein phosphatase 4 regulatory subunit 3B [Myotis davidii]
MADKPSRPAKLYALNENNQWYYLGSGNVTSVPSESQGTFLVVRSESSGSLLLETKVLPDTPYQKQKDTLIVWSENEKHGMALSFPDTESCQETWEAICRVQGKDPTVNITQDLLDDLEEDINETPETDDLDELPNCELSKLKQIANLVTSAFCSPLLKRRLALVLENESYIKELLKLLHTCENVGYTEGLYHLNTIIKGMFFLDKTALLEILFSDECIMDVIGCLEYDPSLDQPKKHREFLTQNANFKEVIPITTCKLRQRIHQTYRIQYIQDILFPTQSVLEENYLSSLKTFIFLNKMEIIHMLQGDDKFLPQIFEQLKDKTIDNDKRRELLFFLKEFVAFAQILKPRSKDALFKTLTQMGILPAIKVVMSLDNFQIKSSAIDIFTYIVDHSPSMIREFIIEDQQNENGSLLINLVIKQMICDTDPEQAGALHIMRLLCLILDPDSMIAMPHKCERNIFLNFFYKQCIHNIILPLWATTSEDIFEEDHVLTGDINNKYCLHDYQTAQLLGIILELLTFCVQHHTYYIKYYILRKDLLRNVLILMKSKHTFLVLCALRLMRKIIGLKDEVYNRYIIEGNLFEPVVNAFLDNGTRYNMLNSAVIELFEYIKVENIKSLLLHVVEKFYKRLEWIEYVPTFKSMKFNYEQEKDRKSQKSLNSMQSSKIFLCRARDLEKNEVSWKRDIENIEEGETSMKPLECDCQDVCDTYMETEKTTENVDKVNLPKRTSSGDVKFTHTHSTGDTNGTDSPMRLVDYSDEEEDKEEEKAFRKRPHVNQ